MVAVVDLNSLGVRVCRVKFDGMFHDVCDYLAAGALALGLKEGPMCLHSNTT